jgi:hypothetical protein
VSVQINATNRKEVNKDEETKRMAPIYTIGSTNQTIKAAYWDRTTIKCEHDLSGVICPAVYKKSY